VGCRKGTVVGVDGGGGYRTVAPVDRQGMGIQIGDVGKASSEVNGLTATDNIAAGLDGGKEGIDVIDGDDRAGGGTRPCIISYRGDDGIVIDRCSAWIVALKLRVAASMAALEVVPSPQTIVTV
jgi:hypothetical protein